MKTDGIVDELAIYELDLLQLELEEVRRSGNQKKLRVEYRVAEVILLSESVHYFVELLVCRIHRPKSED